MAVSAYRSLRVAVLRRPARVPALRGTRGRTHTRFRRTRESQRPRSARRAPIIVKKLGWSSSRSVTALEASRCRSPDATQVGDQIDRPGRQHDPVGAGELVARARARPGGSAHDLGADAALRADGRGTASVAGGSARGFGVWCSRARRTYGSSVASIAAASLSSSIETTATIARPGTDLRKRVGQRAHPVGVVRAVEQVSGSLVDQLQAAWDAHRLRRPRATRTGSSSPR